MSAQDASLDLSSLIGARVQGLKEYAPEPLEQLAERLGLPVGQLIKSDANENPYGPTRHTLDVIGGYTEYHRYPDPISRRLRAALAGFIGEDAERIVVGNGSDELIDLILRVFRPGPDGGGIAQLIDCPPTFGMYQFYGATNDLQVLVVPRDNEFRIDMGTIEALFAADPQPKVLFLASPNNPDGQLAADWELHRLLDLPLLVVLDEAYADFSGDSRVGWVAERDNLVVIRTFSKWAGLAGLRVGYGVFPEAMMTALWRLKSPYNVNGPAQAAALATLEDIDSALAAVGKIVEERHRLIANLRELPFLQVYDSAANYVLCRVRGMDTSTVRQAMERRGVILRYFDRAGLEDCIRISVGTLMQNQAILVVLRSLVS